MSVQSQHESRTNQLSRSPAYGSAVSDSQQIAKELSTAKHQNTMLSQCVQTLQSQLKIEAMRNQQLTEELNSRKPHLGTDDLVLTQKKSAMRAQIIQELELQIIDTTRKAREDLERREKELQFKQSQLDHQVSVLIRDAVRKREQTLDEMSSSLIEKEAVIRDKERIVEDRERRVAVKEIEVENYLRTRQSTSDEEFTKRIRDVEEMERALASRLEGVNLHEKQLAARAEAFSAREGELKAAAERLAERQMKVDQNEANSRDVNQKVEQYLTAIENYAVKVSNEAKTKAEEMKLKEEELKKSELVLKEEWEKLEKRSQVVEEQLHMIDTAQMKIKLKEDELQSKEEAKVGEWSAKDEHIRSISLRQQEFLRLAKEEHDTRLRSLEEVRSKFELERSSELTYLMQQKEQIEKWRNERQVVEDSNKAWQHRLECEQQALAAREEQLEALAARLAERDDQFREKTATVEVFQIEVETLRQQYEERFDAVQKQLLQKIQENDYVKATLDEYTTKNNEMQEEISSFRERETLLTSLEQRAISLDKLEQRLKEECAEREEKWKVDMQAKEQEFSISYQRIEFEVSGKLEGVLKERFNRDIISIGRERDEAHTKRMETEHELQKVRDALTRSGHALEGELATCKAEIGRMEAESFGWKEKFESVSRQCETWRIEMERAAEKEYTLQHLNRELQSTIDDLQRHMFSRESECEKLRADLNSAVESNGKREEEFNRRSEEVASEFELLKAHCFQIERTLNRKSEIVSESEFRIESLRKEVLFFESSAKELEGKLHLAEGAAEKCEHLMATVHDREEQIQRFIVEGRAKDTVIHDLETSLEEGQRTVAGLREEISRIGEDLGSARMEIAEARSEEERLRSEVVSREAELTSSEEKICRLERDLDAEKSSRESSEADLRMTLKQEMQVECEETIAQFRKEVDLLSQERESALLQCKRYQEELAEKENSCSIFESRLAELITKVKSLAEFEERCYELQDLLTDSKHEAETLESRNKDMEVELEELRAKAYNIYQRGREEGREDDSMTGEWRKELQVEQVKCSRISSELEDLRQTLKKKDEQLHHLQCQVSETIGLNPDSTVAGSAIYSVALDVYTTARQCMLDSYTAWLEVSHGILHEHKSVLHSVEVREASTRSEWRRLEDSLNRRAAELVDREARLESDLEALRARAEKMSTIEATLIKRMKEVTEQLGEMEAERSHLKQDLLYILSAGYGVNEQIESVRVILDRLKQCASQRSPTVDVRFSERDAHLNLALRRAEETNQSFVKREFSLLLLKEHCDRNVIVGDELHQRATLLTAEAQFARAASSFRTTASIVSQVEQAARNNERQAALLRKEAEYLTRERVELDSRAQQLRKWELSIMEARQRLSDHSPSFLRASSELELSFRLSKIRNQEEGEDDPRVDAGSIDEAMEIEDVLETIEDLCVSSTTDTSTNPSSEVESERAEKTTTKKTNVTQVARATGLHSTPPYHDIPVFKSEPPVVFTIGRLSSETHQSGTYRNDSDPLRSSLPINPALESVFTWTNDARRSLRTDSMSSSKGRAYSPLRV